MRILVLEDDPAIRAPLAAGLREAGYAVDECEGSSEAEGLAGKAAAESLTANPRASSLILGGGFPVFPISGD